MLATLKTPTAANPGQTLRVTGVNYQTSAAYTPVQIRFNSRTGQELARTTATSPGGRIATDVPIPPGTPPGWYSLNGTQYRNDNGQPAPGTPGRTTVRVSGAAAGAASPWGSAPGGGAAVKVGDPGAGSPALAPTLLGIAFSLGLLGAGLTLVSRSRTRKADRPLLGV